MNQSYDPPPEQDSSTPPPPPPGGGYGAPYGQQQTQSGGKGMAITALVLGIRLPANFREPYLSCSIREFWRRWHITLSRFLRDYPHDGLILYNGILEVANPPTRKGG